METADQSEAETADQQSRNLRIFARFVSLGFGYLLLAGCALYLVLAWLDEPSWSSVQGTVTEKGVLPFSTSFVGKYGSNYENTRYQPRINYRYRVGGRDYEGIRIGEGWTPNYAARSDAVIALARYSRSPLTVYYDPTNPGRSVLITGIVPGFIMVLGSIGLLLVALSYIIRWVNAGDEAAEEEPAPLGIDGAQEP
jgi:hypothetical protein